MQNDGPSVEAHLLPERQGPPPTPRGTPAAHLLPHLPPQPLQSFLLLLLPPQLIRLLQGRPQPLCPLKAAPLLLQG